MLHTEEQNLLTWDQIKQAFIYIYRDVRDDGQSVMRESPERNEDYFGCIDRSTGTKVHASFMLFCADTIFRTVGARVEIDV